MKTIITFKLFLLYTTLTTAQSPIVPLLDFGNLNEWTNGAYHKDVNNDMNKFIGEWLWQDGNNSLTIKLGKVEMVQRTYPPDNLTLFEDILYGEYRYVESGTVMINTLPEFENVAQPWLHNMRGSTLVGTNHMPPCSDCAANEVRIILTFKDPNRVYIWSSILLRHGVQWWNQQEYIIAHLYTQWSPAGSEFKVNTIPSGTYTLYKQ